MIDVQNQGDNRGIKIRRTGVSDVCLPLFIFDDGKSQQVTATIRFTVSLAENLRGTHMSRLMEILTDQVSKPLKVCDVEKILQVATEKLETDFAEIKIAFKFFVKRTAPVSGRESFLDTDCEIFGELSRGEKMKLALSLTVPFTSLCPCSKEISDFGAHNQRSLCKVKIIFSNKNQLKNFGIEKLVNLIESQSSCKIYPILKREDEKFVTEAAYKNPKFVEDILRDVVAAVRKVKNLSAFEVECKNFESIHNHNACAFHSETF